MNFNDKYHHGADCLYAFQWGEETRLLDKRYGEHQAQVGDDAFMEDMGYNMEFLYFYNCGKYNMPELCWDDFSGKSKQ